MKLFKLHLITVGIVVACLVISYSYAQSTETKNNSTDMLQSANSKYGLHGSLTAKEGKADQLVSILLKASELVSKAKGCHLYIISKDSENKNEIWVTEVWDSKEDHDNSLKNEEVRELISKAMPLIDGEPEKGFELEVIGGAGL